MTIALKGSVYCGQCGERLTITNAKNRHGNIYPHFVCSGRHSGKTECTRQAMLIEDVERLIKKYYEMIEVSPVLRQDLATESSLRKREMCGSSTSDPSDRFATRRSR